ncbi:MAG TPA: response regulator [Enhygromyxa sp.]|nr:response regulator [Enhygromyxa sp.]
MNQPDKVESMQMLARSQTAQILVVDDVPENLLAIEAALQGLGNELVFAGSGPDALRQLLERDFALILLDVQMPSMDGLETARMIRARQRTRHVPIIFITAYDRDDDAVLAGYRLGAVDFLFKPINAEILRAKASVFVELQRRTAEVARQAVQLREHEQVERARALADQRRQLEAAALRSSVVEHRQQAELLMRTNLELERARAQLELADRRKDEFIAVLAHELRNPLAAIVSGLDVLATDPSVTVVQTVRTIMERQGRHLTRLVDDLLDIARITSGKLKLRKQLVRVREVLDDALELATPGIVANGNLLEVECECGDARLFGDPVRLAQVIGNLLSNAVRYTDRGGHIRVSARADEREQVRIVVKDDGRGMPPALVSRVFEMFVQGDGDGGGLGIGLTLVQQLTQLHGGEVTARSDGPGRGSEFELRLPIAGSEAAPEIDEQAIGEQSDAAQMRVAVIDDDRDVRELTRAVLECWGHSVVEAADGHDGISLVISEQPDVAIIDIGLRDIEGYEVARRLRAELGDRCPRLIAMTGFGQPRDRERAFAAGFNAYLPKPAKSEALRSAMHPSLD